MSKAAVSQETNKIHKNAREKHDNEEQVKWYQ